MIRECTTGPEGCLVRDAQSVRGKGGHGPEGPWRVHRLDQSVLSRNAVSWDFDRAPTLVASTSPFLNGVTMATIDPWNISNPLFPGAGDYPQASSFSDPS